MEILQMMNNCAHSELIAFEVKHCQEACEGRHKCVGWPVKTPKHMHSQIHTYMHERMHAQAHTSCYGTCSRQTWFWYVINLKLIALGFSSHHLSWQELSSNLFQACLWCKCFPPTVWFGLCFSWRTFHTFLLEQRDVKAFFSYRDRLKSPPCFQLGPAALKVVSVRLHNKAPSLPTSFMRRSGVA